MADVILFFSPRSLCFTIKCQRSYLLIWGGEDLNISLYIKVKEESCDGK